MKKAHQDAQKKVSNTLAPHESPSPVQVHKQEGFEIMVSNKDAVAISQRAKQAHEELEHYRKMINKVLDAEAHEESKE